MEPPSRDTNSKVQTTEKPIEEPTRFLKKQNAGKNTKRDKGRKHRLKEAT